MLLFFHVKNIFVASFNFKICYFDYSQKCRSVSETYSNKKKIKNVKNRMCFHIVCASLNFHTYKFNSVLFILIFIF